MIDNPAYLIRGDDRNTLHKPGCYVIEDRDDVDEVAPSDHRARGWCAYCKDAAPVRDRYPCPCGTGHAVEYTRTTNEANGTNGHHTATHHHYRHEGCPVGGTVVSVKGEVKRRFGPLFEPERYAPTASASD